MPEYNVEQIPIEKLDILPEDLELIDREVIEDLKTNLREAPLLHPLTTISKDGKHYIKAGRKRFFALRELDWKAIPCLLLSADLTPEEIQEITISENLRRYNLPWYEQAIKRLELHNLRQRQHGVGKQGKKTGWSLRDTAAELSVSLGAISEDLRLAEAVISNPNLRKIEDKKTAKRLIFNEFKRLDAEASAGVEVKVDYNCVLCGDASEVLKFYPASTFDVVFTDPPWLEYKDEKLTKDDRTVEVFKELYRVMKNDSFLYAMVSTPDFFVYQQELPKMGFKVQTMPLIWVKTGMISHGTRSWEYARDYEPILLAVKGSPVLTTAGQLSAVYESKVVHATQLIHPNEKPVDVPMNFLRHCTYEGSLVLDPFGGSGVTAEACIRMGRRYVTIEREKKFAVGIEERLNAIQRQEASGHNSGEVREGLASANDGPGPQL